MSTDALDYWSYVMQGFQGSSKGVNIHTDNFLFEIEILLSDEEMFSHLKWNHLDYANELAKIL